MGTKGMIFITGATGLVGSLLAVKVLQRGHSVRLLVHRRGNRSAQERVRLALDVFGFSHDQWHQRQPDIETHEGDIAQPQFGLSHKEWRKSAEGLSAIYHAAAYCGFQNNEIAKSTAVNVEGTRNILKFADISRTHLFYISSAYIVGDAENRTLEQELKGPRRWKNPYEETKFLAEREVHSHCRRNELKYTVFRPAILIGDSAHGRTIRFHSIYHYMKLFHHLATRRKASPVILEAKPGASLNILPVDFAIDAIWDISQSPECERKIFHITNPFPPKFTELASMAERLFGLRIEFTERSVSGMGTSNKRERKIEDPFSRYRPYMFGEPDFDLTNTRSLLKNYDAAFPELNERYFRQILDYAIAHQWGKHGLSSPPQKSEKSPLRFTDRYFQEFLMSKLNQQLIQNLKNLSAVVSINIQDEETSNWALKIEGGTLTAISQDSLNAECNYVLDAETFEQIARGHLQPQQAFFDGRANIEGNIEKGLQVATALSEFCKSHPFDPKDDPK